MKNKLFKKALFMLPLLVLSSCGGGNSSGSNQPSSSMKNNDELLKSFNIPVRETFENNFWDNERLPDVKGTQAADPFVLRFNGKYYLYVTTGGGRCLCWTSDDLINWSKNSVPGLPVGYCLVTDKLASPWAPEVRYINGKFYFISSFSGGGHYIFVSENPGGPFTILNDAKVGGGIDASFFVDSDEKVYATIAGTGGIVLKRLKDDFSSFKEDKFDCIYLNTKTGRWTEGPYITKRFGQYYLTYTGVDCYAPSYRVEYNYYDGNQETPITNSGAFKQMGGAILLKTDEEYMGLGHSANVLGPDMDSYYITYHSLTLNYGSNGSVASNKRTYNFSRLSFNGSTLVADSGDLSDNFVPRRPEFETADVNGLIENQDYYLSESESDECFTCEYNYVGNDARFIFSYIDENNYYYCQYANNTIELRQIENGNDNLLETITLNKECDFDYLHSLRVNYGEGLLNIYFDDIEKLSNKEITLPKGKMGYKTLLRDDIHYTAMSNVGGGISDSMEYQKNQSLANQYDRKVSNLENSKLERITASNEVLNYTNSFNMHLFKGERATYKTYFANNKTNISIRMPKSMAGKTIGIRINDKEAESITVPDSGFNDEEIVINLGNFATNVGQNYVSVVAKDNDVYFSRLDYTAITETNNGTYSAKLDLCDTNVEWIEHGREQVDYYNAGLSCSGDDNCFAYINGYKTVGDGSISVDVNIKEEFEDKFSDNRRRLGTLTCDSEALAYRYGSGVALGVRNHEYYYGGDNYEACVNNVQGILFYINNERYVIKQANYHHTEIIKSEARAFELNKRYKLTLERENNIISCYIDDELVHKFVTNEFSSVGKLGLYSFFNECTYNNLTVKAK